LEERVSALFAAGNPVRAMAVDGAGTAAIRELTRRVGERLCDEARQRDLTAGMRASPGEDGWLIEQQRVLFDLLPANEIGIQLTDHCLMVPRKSTSFVIGLGPAMRADATVCDFCARRERCAWRQSSADLNFVR
jgi:hypothetical protein